MPPSLPPPDGLPSFLILRIAGPLPRERGPATLSPSREFAALPSPARSPGPTLAPARPCRERGLQSQATTHAFRCALRPAYAGSQRLRHSSKPGNTLPHAALALHMDAQGRQIWIAIIS